MLHTGRLLHWDKHAGLFRFLVSGIEKSFKTLPTNMEIDRIILSGTLAYLSSWLVAKKKVVVSVIELFSLSLILV